MSWDLAIWIIVVARSPIMVAPVSPAALIISTTMASGPAALPGFMYEMYVLAFFTMSVVIISGPPNGGSLDR